jgi:hypothetical protein
MVSSLTVWTDMDPCPRARVDIDPADLDVGADAVTVWQLSSSALGSAEVRVRSAIEVASAGGVVVTDYEIPLGVPVTYRVEQFTAGVSIGFSDVELTGQADIADGHAVLTDPLDPARSVLVDAHIDFGGVLQRTRPTRVYRAGDFSAALSGLRGLLEVVPLRCNTRTVADYVLLDQVLASTQFLVRLMPSGGLLPSAFNVVVPSPAAVPVDVQYGGSWVQWELTGQEVSRSEIDVLVPVVNYQLFADAFATYGDAASAYSTYLDALRTPPSAA